MKKAYFLLLFALFSTPVLAQSVGVNTTNPSAAAALDVRPSATAGVGKGVAFPNLGLASVTDATTVTSPPPGLLVYNTTTTLPGGAGLYFNNGTAAAPVWVAFTKSVQNFHAFNTAARTTSSATAAVQPGCTISVVVPTGQTVDVKVDAVVGAYLNSNTVYDYATVESVIYLDGAILPKGGYNQFSLDNVDQAAATISTLSTWIAGLTAGTHTIELRTRRRLGNVGVIIGGNAATDANAGEIHATVYYR